MTNALKSWYNNINLFLTLLQLKQVQTRSSRDSPFLTALSFSDMIVSCI